MITLTRINHASLILNSDLIEHLEVTPDTVISLTTGQKLIVLESPEEVVERVVAFRRSICQPFDEAVLAAALACPPSRAVVPGATVEESAK